jgi:UDP-2,3-diacylglucosamine hydrolase
MKSVKIRTYPRTPTREKIYFFSDAHLGLGSTEEERQKEKRIIRFLEFIKRDASQLFIVGDLFDYWFEYKTVIPKRYFHLLSKLAELSEHGICISFIVGNHDFWIKNYFKDELGIKIYYEPIEQEIQGKRFLINHGDGLWENDIGYRILKRILRNRINIFVFSLIHPDITGFIARWSSRTSRKYTNNRRYEGDGMVAYATQKLYDGFDFVIMGHSHIPSYREINQGVYVNLGDWIIENTYAVFDGKKLKLKKWTD